MPIGTCDPASRGQAHNGFTVVAQDGGPCVINGVYDWDGVSVKPDCDGPLVSLTGVNSSPSVTYFAWFLSKANVPRSVTLPPNSTQTVVNPQLRNAGFRNYSDCDGICLTPSATSPF